MVKVLAPTSVRTALFHGVDSATLIELAAYQQLFERFHSRFFYTCGLLVIVVQHLIATVVGRADHIEAGSIIDVECFFSVSEQRGLVIDTPSVPSTGVVISFAHLAQSNQTPT